MEILGSLDSSLWVCGTYDKGSSMPFSVEPFNIPPPFLPAPINTAMACLMPLLATLSLPRPVALWKRYSSFYIPLSLKWVYPYLRSGKLVRCPEDSRKCPSFVSIILLPCSWIVYVIVVFKSLTLESSFFVLLLMVPCLNSKIMETAKITSDP